MHTEKNEEEDGQGLRDLAPEADALQVSICCSLFSVHDLLLLGWSSIQVDMVAQKLQPYTAVLWLLACTCMIASPYQRLS